MAGRGIEAFASLARGIPEIKKPVKRVHLTE